MEVIQYAHICMFETAFIIIRRWRLIITIYQLESSTHSNENHHQILSDVIAKTTKLTSRNVWEEADSCTV